LFPWTVVLLLPWNSWGGGDVVLVADNPLKLGTANKPVTTSPHAVECISLMKGSIKICTWNSGSQLLKIAFNPVLLFLGGSLIQNGSQQPIS
jgi:hypothetical protein